MLFIRSSKISQHKNIFVLIGYQSNGLDWLKISLGSFRIHFPSDDILVVRHSQDPQELDIMNRHRAIIIDRSSKVMYHGPTLDIVKTIVQHDYDTMTMFEPDCLIQGRRWYENMQSAILDGAWMAGPSRKFGGVICICPCMWLISQIPYSFGNDFRHEASNEEEFMRTFDLQDCLTGELRDKPNWSDIYYYLYHWDTGQKNWYHAAKRNKATLTQNPDFIHFWQGRWRSPKSPTKLLQCIESGHTNIDINSASL
jgi:hypothetical protein